MIHTIRTVAVGDQESKIDSPIILYRGDREVEVEFTINGSKFTFTNGGNVIKSTGNRPTDAESGSMWFDSTLGKPIWKNGSNWVDASGKLV